MTALNDITKQRFYRLVVVSRSIIKSSSTMWNCVCDCGGEIIVNGSHLKRGNIRSCGCLRREITTKKNTTHGMTKTPEFITWQNMKTRCYNENKPKYNLYGGRGIKVCERWLYSFENFFSDMGKRPHNKHSIDRIDNNGDYTPDNCRWATNTEQNNNRRNSIKIKFKGKTQCISMWADELKISNSCLYGRLKRLALHDAMTYK